ncbi:MAG: dienelactone hydrolase [Acidimicrobiales bacterium]|nr:dienelactone hydrolase [Acidimicrobiales bacterium]
MLLAPGASAGADQPSLVALDRAATGRGLVVCRIDFPYRLAGRRRPDPPPVLQETVRQRTEALSARLGVTSDQLVLGGRSMGGRICSEAVAAGLPAAGLVLISYPLHPPGRPDRPRSAHLPAISVPCLFVSGTRDAFGSPEELEAATSVIPGPVTHVFLPGGDHGLRNRDPLVTAAVMEWLEARLLSS